MKRERIRFKRLSIGSSSLLRISTLLAIFFALLASGVSIAREKEDSCVECHGNPDFLVTNKKLYDYFREWSSSVHKQEEVRCVDCHGGNPDVSDKDGAHGGNLAVSESKSATNFRNIPDTCGECHEEYYDAYRESAHYEHLVKAKEERQGPNCVTCHGAINSQVLNVATVKEACARCHNEETKNNSDIPDRAETLLNKFLSIHRYYRYIGIRGAPEDNKKFFEKVDRSIHKLAVNWHTFDIEDIEERMEIVLMVMKAKREELRKEHRARRAAEAQRP